MAIEEGDGDKELPDEDKGTGNRLVFKGKNVIKDSGLKVEAVNDDVKSDDVGTLQAKDSQSQQQEQGWQRFLHVTSIKVLLVENDDSTRYILTALLRNCNYEVIEAANGLQAWKILENLTNHIDLVLSEVVMPGVSGLGLLYKIMSHKTRNNIPVIMMSSHDSMGLVFKCLSKGAVDFLVKPIRKNELKNLWQHVWRRCHSSSGSGSESGSQTQKSVKSKRSEQYGNNSGSDDRDDNRRNGPLGNGSDDGSGTQSSWTKQAVEVDSSQAVSPCDQALEHVDSTCARALSFNEDTSAHGRVHLNPSRDESDDAREGKPSITGSLRDPKLKPENAIEDSLKNLGARHKSAVEMDSNASNLKANHHVVTADKVVDSLEINITSTDDSKHHVVESSLKRPRGLEEAAIAFQVNCNVLRRSELSAFSRYSSSSNQTRTLNGITQCSSLVETSLETAKSEPMPETEARTNKKLVDLTTNGVRDSAAMGSTTNILSSEPLPFRNTNGNSDTGLACTSRSGNASGCGFGNTMDPFKLVRAAALTKFRQKKKERCFMKKVRYQNRKRLAEERPHVRGQFVRNNQQNNLPLCAAHPGPNANTRCFVH